MVTDLANYLADHNWNVNVVTALPQAPYWRIYEAYKGRVVQREVSKGVNVRRGRVYLPRLGNSGSVRSFERVLFDSSFALTALLLGVGVAHPDVIVAVSPPIQSVLPALVLKAIWGAPIFLWVQDIVPDAAVSTGMMKPGLWLSVARRLESFAYRNADRVGVIAPGFRRNLTLKGVPASKIIDVPNWTDISLHRGVHDGLGVRAELGYRADDFIVLHAGSVAAKQCLGNAIRAMKILEGEDHMHLVVVGDGNRLAAVKREAETAGLSRVRFLPPRTGQHYADILQAADALLLNQCRAVTDMLIPSKLLTYLPSGKPVIAAVNGDSEAAQFLKQAGCSLIVDPEEPDELAGGFLQLRNDAGLCERLGRAGAAYAPNFDRERVLPTFVAVLTELADSQTPPKTPAVSAADSP